MPNDYETLAQKLAGSQNAALRRAAESPEGQALAQKLDAGAVNDAARRGDMNALKNILTQVLTTPEGKALAQKLRQDIQGK